MKKLLFIIHTYTSISTWKWFALLSIVLFGILLRLYKLGDLPSSMYIDEVAMLAEVRSVLSSGNDINGNSWFQALFAGYGDYKQPVYIWLAVVTSWLFGANDFSIRLVSAVAGIGSIIVVYFLTYYLIDNTKHASMSAVSAALVMAVSPWSVLFSRTGFEGHLAQSLLALSALCVIVSKKYRWLLVLSVVLGVIATYSYFSVRFVWPIVFIVMIVFTYFKNINPLTNKDSINFFLLLCIALSGYALALIPMIRSPYYEASNILRLSTRSVLNSDNEILSSNIYREISGNTVVDRLFFHRYLLTVRELITNYSDHLSIEFLFINGDSNLRHGTGEHGVFLTIFLLPLIAGLVWLAHKKPAVLALLILWIVAALLPASIPEETPHALRSINALVPFIVIIGAGCGQIYQLINQLKKPVQTFFLIVSSLLVVYSITSFVQYYFVIYPIESQNAWSYGRKELAEMIANFNQDKVIFLPNIDDKFFVWVLAYGKKNLNEYHHIVRNGFVIKQLDTIYFDRHSFTPDDTFVVAGENGSVQETIQSIPRTADIEAITGKEGQTLFTLATLKKSDTAVTE